MDAKHSDSEITHGEGNVSGHRPLCYLLRLLGGLGCGARRGTGDRHRAHQHSTTADFNIRTGQHSRANQDPTAHTSSSTNEAPGTNRDFDADPGSTDCCSERLRSERIAARVVEVIDGDTLDVDLSGKVVRLRLIGIDTPETKDPRKPIECFGQEASARAYELLNSQAVELEADPSQDDQDQYGRLLRYVWLPDGRLFNEEMIAQGYAFEYTYRVPYKYQAEFKAAEQAAREAQHGLWSAMSCNGQHIPAQQTPPTTAPLQPSPAPTQVPAQAGTCDPSYPGVCIPPTPPDLDCKDIPYRRFQVLPPDPHRFDGNKDGVGCENN